MFKEKTPGLFFCDQLNDGFGCNSTTSCKECLEDLYQEIKKILDKDILDELLDEF